MYTLQNLISHKFLYKHTFDMLHHKFIFMVIHILYYITQDFVKIINNIKIDIWYEYNISIHIHVLLI
jgi:hypothetical protein